MFQRFTVVMEYEQKPALPPPFIFFSHIVLLFKYLRRKCKGVQETYDNGLKLFLDNEDLERLYDFEEECVEGYFREQEMKLQASTDERIKQTNERVDNINQKVEDINQKENNQNSSLQVIFTTRSMILPLHSNICFKIALKSAKVSQKRFRFKKRDWVLQSFFK